MRYDNKWDRENQPVEQKKANRMEPTYRQNNRRENTENNKRPISKWEVGNRTDEEKVIRQHKFWLNRR